MKNITAWDDPVIATLNPGVTLPSNDIATIVSSDSSGTTFVFSGYLAVVSDDFASHLRAGQDRSHGRTGR